MKCVLFNQSVKVLSRAIHSLARIGDEMVVEPFKHGLKLSTVDKSESAYTQFWFPVQSFFYSYKYEDTENPDDLRLKISFKALLTVFKTCHSADKIVASCTIQIENNIPAMIIKMQFNAGYSKTHSLFISDCVPINANYSNTGRNEIVLPPKILSNALRNFHSHQAEITLAVDTRKTIINNFDDKTLESSGQNIRSQLSLDPGEFTNYRIGLDTAINFTVREIKAMLAFAENVSGVLKITFDEPTKPIVFNILEPGMFEANYILATESSDSMTTIGSSASDVSSSISAARGRGIRRVLSAEEDPSGGEPKRACTNENRVGTNNNDGNSQNESSFNIRRNNASSTGPRENDNISSERQNDSISSSQRPNDGSFNFRPQNNSTGSHLNAQNNSSLNFRPQNNSSHSNAVQTHVGNLDGQLSGRQSNRIVEEDEENVFSKAPMVNCNGVSSNSKCIDRENVGFDAVRDVNLDVQSDNGIVSEDTVHRVGNSSTHFERVTKNPCNSTKNPSNSTKNPSNSTRNPSSNKVVEKVASSNVSDHFDEKFSSIENILFGESNVTNVRRGKPNGMSRQVNESIGDSSNGSTLRKGHSRDEGKEGSISYRAEITLEEDPVRSRLEPNQSISKNPNGRINISGRSEVYSDIHTSNESANFRNSRHEEIAESHSPHCNGQLKSQSIRKVAIEHHVDSSNSSLTERSNRIESFDGAILNEFEPVEDFEMEPVSQDTTTLNVCTPLNAEKLSIVFRHCLEGNIGTDVEPGGGKVLVYNSDEEES